MTKTIFLQSSTNSGSYSLSVPFSVVIFDPWEEGIWRICSSYRLAFHLILCMLAELWVCTDLHLLKIETFLIKVFLHTCSYNLIRCVWLPLLSLHPLSEYAFSGGLSKMTFTVSAIWTLETQFIVLWKEGQEVWSCRRTYVNEGRFWEFKDLCHF